MNDSIQRVAESCPSVRLCGADCVPIHARAAKCDQARPGRDSERAWDVVLVSLSGGGRGHITAALTAKPFDRRVLAQVPPRAQNDPHVRAVIDALGLDPDEQFARPATDEVLRGADLIVTMGHGVRVIEIPRGARHEEWGLGGPHRRSGRGGTPDPLRHRTARPGAAHRAGSAPGRQRRSGIRRLGLREHRSGRILEPSDSRLCCLARRDWLTRAAPRKRKLSADTAWAICDDCGDQGPSSYRFRGPAPLAANRARAGS
jgi:hypothetical protein